MQQNLIIVLNIFVHKQLNIKTILKKSNLNIKASLITSPEEIDLNRGRLGKL